MTKLIASTLFILVTFSASAQITRKVSPAVTKAQMVKLKSISINPSIISARKSQLGNSSFTNPSFSRTLVNGDNISVNYTLRPVSLSDNANSSNVEVAPSNSTPPSNMNCTYTREKVTATSTDFMSVTQTGEGILPGAIYKYDDFYKGNFQAVEIKSWARNPVIISSDAAQSVTVQNPNTQLSDAVISLKNATPADPGTIVTSQYTYSNNSTVLALNATAGGAYAGFSAQVGFNFSKSDSTIYITYDYRKILFSLTAQIPSNGFFADISKEQTPNLIWLGGVSYGARILANVKINASQLKIGANAQFQYGDPKKAGFQAAADFKDNNQSLNCTVNIYSVGLPSSATLVGTINTTLADLDQRILNALNAVTSQTAKPVMYSLYNMAGERIAVESATDYYDNRLCIPKDALYRLQSASVEIITGAGGFDDKLDGSIGTVTLKCCNGAYTVSSAANNLKIDPKAVTNFELSTPRSSIILNDFKTGNVEIKLDPKYILGVPDAWRIVGATLTMNFVSQTGTPYPGNPVKLSIPSVGSGVTLSKEKPLLVCPIEYNGGTANGGFRALTPNQR